MRNLATAIGWIGRVLAALFALLGAFFAIAMRAPLSAVLALCFGCFLCSAIAFTSGARLRATLERWSDEAEADRRGRF